MDKNINLQRLSTEAKVFLMEVSCWATAVVMGKHKLWAYFSISSTNHKICCAKKLLALGPRNNFYVMNICIETADLSKST